MTKAKHTQGPWGISGAGNKTRLIFRATDTSVYPVCEVTADNLNRYGAGDLDANAALIAAAPELLEALEELVLQSAGNDPVEVMKLAKDANWPFINSVKKAREAIAKAKGAV